MDNTAHRFTLKSFRRYEPYLIMFVKQHPKLVKINPTLLSTETFACRCRDAAKSFIQNNWDSALNLDQFTELWADAQVVVRGAHIYIGNKLYIKDMDSATHDASCGEIIEEGASVNMKSHPHHQQQIIRALATLLTHGIIKQMPLTNIDIDYVNTIIAEAQYDVEVIETSNNKLLMI